MLPLLVVLLSGNPAYAGDAVNRFQQADFIGSDATTPPADDADWRPQSLPDELFRRNPDFGWYRVRIQIPQAPKEPFAIFLPRMSAEATMYVNGVEVSRVPAPYQYSFNQPRTSHLSTVPQSLIQVGTNTLHVRVTSAGAPMMSEIEWGTQSQLLKRYEAERFWRSTAPAMALSVAAFIAFITLTFWILRPAESTYAYFGLAVLLKLPFAARPLLPLSTALPPGAVGWLLNILIVTSNALMFAFALRYGGWKLPRLERALWWLWLPTYVLFDTLNYFGSGAVSDVSGPIQLAATYVSAIFYIAVFIVVAWTRRDVETSLVAGASVLATALALYEGYFRLHTELSWVPYRLLPLFVIVTWALMKQFARTLDDSEKLNAELAARVESKRQELEANYHRLGELEKEQAVVAERARLMRDMHDGIGGQLISTLSLVETGEATKEKVAAALRECIDDLRLAIDSLEPADEDLLPVLGNLRYRVEPRLKARGIELDWEVQDMPKLAYMTPQNVLHVLRILQEAFTNVIKHAGASHVRVATRCESGRVMIDVTDDGRGMTCSHDRPVGHGLANMRQRALALGGELFLQASNRGTTVTLGLPMTIAGAG